VDQTMIVVTVGVVIVILLAYWHGRLAGFVAKVKADAAAADKSAANRLVALGTSSGVLGKSEGALKHFGDEIVGWAKHAKPGTADPSGLVGHATASQSPATSALAPVEPPAPQPSKADRVAAIKLELDALMQQSVA